jgi:hypothetical protein
MTEDQQGNDKLDDVANEETMDLSNSRDSTIIGSAHHSGSCAEHRFNGSAEFSHMPSRVTLIPLDGEDECTELSGGPINEYSGKNADSDNSPLSQTTCQVGKSEALNALLSEWNGDIRILDLAEAVTSIRFKVIDMEKVQLLGSQDDFDKFQEAISSDDALECFAMRAFRIQDRRVSFDELMRTLASLPKLRTLHLEASRHACVTFSGASIADLCKSRVLSELSLAGIELDVFHISIIADAIKKNPTLKKVRLGLNDQGTIRIAKAITDCWCGLKVLI